MTSRRLLETDIKEKLITWLPLMGSSAQNIKETINIKEINYKATCLVLRCCHGIMRAFHCGVGKVLPWGDCSSKLVSNAASNQNQAGTLD